MVAEANKVLSSSRSADGARVSVVFVAVAVEASARSLPSAFEGEGVAGEFSDSPEEVDA